MSYATNEDLPASVRAVLPVHAQNIYREAYNRAWATLSDPTTQDSHETREQAAEKAAWAAVSQTYEKLDNTEMWGERDYHRYLDQATDR